MFWECSNASNLIPEFDINNETNTFLKHDLNGVLIRPILYTDGSFGLNAVASRSLRLVHSMAFLLNFTVKPVYGDGWITIGLDGSLEGVGKLLEASAGDLLSQTHELTLDRAEKLQFVFPTVTHREEAFFRQPSRMYEDIIIRAFHINFRFVLLGFGITLAVLMWMISSTNPGLLGTPVGQSRSKFYKWRRNHWHLENNYPVENGTFYPFQLSRLAKNLEASVLWVIAILAQQGSWFGTEGNIKLQLISILALCISFTANSMYSAKVLSIIKAREAPITSYSKLLDSGMKLYVDRDAQNTIRLFKDTLNVTNVTFITSRTLSADDGLLKILKKNSNTAFLSYRFYMDNSARYYGEEIFLKYCNLISSVSPNPRGLQVYNGMFVRKRSPLRKIFRYSLVLMMERGLLDSELQSEYVSTSKKWCKASLDGFESLPYSVTAPCFTLLLIGSLTSIAILILENFIEKAGLEV